MGEEAYCPNCQMKKMVLILSDEVGESDVDKLREWGKEYGLEVLDFVDRTKILVEAVFSAKWTDKFSNTIHEETIDEWVESWWIIASELEHGVGSLLEDIVLLENYKMEYFDAFR